MVFHKIRKEDLEFVSFYVTVLIIKLETQIPRLKTLTVVLFLE